MTFAPQNGAAVARSRRRRGRRCLPKGLAGEAVARLAPIKGCRKAAHLRDDRIDDRHPTREPWSVSSASWGTAHWGASTRRPSVPVADNVLPRLAATSRVHCGTVHTEPARPFGARNFPFGPPDLANLDCSQL